jgi:hypothetical protein
MSLKNKPVRNGSSPASFERRKRDKTGHLLNGLVADLERRTQVVFETNNNNFHVESIQGIHRLLLQVILVDHHQAEPVLICLFFFSLSLSHSSFFLLLLLLLLLVSPLKPSLDPSTATAAAH